MANFAKILRNLHSAKTPLFAVVDGAQFENLPEALMFGGFVSRSLYLDRGDNDREQVMTAPQMIWLDETREIRSGRRAAKTISALLDLVDGKPAVVFWQCPAGGDALYRHLRGLNMVQYPKSHLEDWVEPETEEGAPEPDTHTPVLFRHADANVVAQVVPAMPGTELARFFGPATHLAFAPDPGWTRGQSYMSLARPDDLPAAQLGMLRLSETTLSGIDQAEAMESRARIREYLQETAPDHVAILSDDELTNVILNAERMGQKIGLESEYAYGLWTFLALITGEETLRNPQIMGHFEHDPRPADEVVEELIGQIENASDEDLEAWS